MTAPSKTLSPGRWRLFFEFPRFPTGGPYSQKGHGPVTNAGCFLLSGSLGWGAPHCGVSLSLSSSRCSTHGGAQPRRRCGTGRRKGPGGQAMAGVPRARAQAAAPARPAPRAPAAAPARAVGGRVRLRGGAGSVWAAAAGDKAGPGWAGLGWAGASCSVCHRTTPLHQKRPSHTPHPQPADAPPNAHVPSITLRRRRRRRRSDPANKKPALAPQSKRWAPHRIDLRPVPPPQRVRQPRGGKGQGRVEVVPPPHAEWDEVKAGAVGALLGLDHRLPNLKAVARAVGHACRSRVRAGPQGGAGCVGRRWLLVLALPAAAAWAEPNPPNKWVAPIEP
jgi:hypothetical protein